MESGIRFTVTLRSISRADTPLEAFIMHAFVKVMVAAATIDLCAIGLCASLMQAAPANMAAQQNFAPLTLLVQDVYRYDGNGYLPACPSGLFYACY